MAAVPVSREDLTMTNDSPTKTSHALTSSYGSASAHSQLPRQVDGRSLKTDFKEQSPHHSMNRSPERSRPTVYSGTIEQQQEKPHQFSVAEKGMNTSALAYSREHKQQSTSFHAQSNMDARMRDQQLEGLLEDAQVDLKKTERQLNDLKAQYRRDVATKEQQYYSLQDQFQAKILTKDQELKALTDDFEARNIQNKRENDEYCQLWKQTAKELRKYQAQDKVLDQVTDSELIQKARQIQYNVRNFACQHFGGEPNTGKNAQGSWQYLQKQLQIRPNLFEACIRSPVKRPMLVVACLWTFLVHTVFEKFWWGGWRVHQPMNELTEILSKPLRSNVLADRYEVQRKYQMWKASTSALLVDALNFDQERDQGMSRKLREKVQDLCKQLAPITKSKYDTLASQVSDIFKEALELDKLISKQVADIYWTDVTNKPERLDEMSMELQQGEMRTENSQEVQLIVAPGLIKEGKSTGEDYEMKSILLKETVSCELMRDNMPGENHKPPLPPRDSSKPGTFMKIFTSKEPK